MKRSDQAKARQQMLAQNPECIVCGDTNVDVLELDHIIELADGGAPNDPANWTLLCHDCHHINTQHARRARNQRKTRQKNTQPRG
jgi:5-methylcytosine-specific restriction endonuclease McrA